MYEKLNFTRLVAAIQAKFEEHTDIKAYDLPPLNTPAPFFFIEPVTRRPADSKTMFRDVFTVYIHCIAPETNQRSNVGVYNLINKADEIMTEDITLPEPFQLVMQTNNGINRIYNVDRIYGEKTGEVHAVIELQFTVLYGFKCKV